MKPLSHVQVELAFKRVTEGAWQNTLNQIVMSRLQVRKVRRNQTIWRPVNFTKTDHQFLDEITGRQKVEK